ncbi:MAG: DUF4143 domain-containing protein [Candidatus Eisenbacteria bacterium]
MTDHPRFFNAPSSSFFLFGPRGTGKTSAALEGLVAQHLRAWNSYRGRRNQLSYWRTRSGSEVDLIVYGEDGFFAMEVKNSATLHPADLRGLKAFGEDYPEARRMLIYRGNETREVDGIRCVPCERFLATLTPEVVDLSTLA